MDNIVKLYIALILGVPTMLYLLLILLCYKKKWKIFFKILLAPPIIFIIAFLWEAEYLPFASRYHQQKTNQLLTGREFYGNKILLLNSIYD